MKVRTYYGGRADMISLSCKMQRQKRDPMVSSNGLTLLGLKAQAGVLCFGWQDDTILRDIRLEAAGEIEKPVTGVLHPNGVEPAGRGLELRAAGAWCHGLSLRKPSQARPTE